MELGPIASLALEDKQIAKVVRGIESAVTRSFLDDMMPGRIILVHASARPTKDEMKRRAAICIEVIRTLRGDLKWGIERILDTLHTALRAKLDGTTWEPMSNGRSWVGAEH